MTLPEINLSELDGKNGLSINGINSLDASGFSVSGAGDINGDGVGDLIIGAPFADLSGDASTEGQSYLVFGNAGGFDASFKLADLEPENGGDGTKGFVLNGINSYDLSGSSVSNAGDINGDGFDDLILGSPLVDINGYQSGQSYVIFGSDNTFEAVLELDSLDGNNGFALNGIGFNSYSGTSVSNAGDINGDGFDDLIIGAPDAYMNGISSGQTYVVFGSNGGFSSALELNSLDGMNGFSIIGIDDFDSSGKSVSNAGDINGDGIDDLIVGAPGAYVNGNYTGQAYVIFGSRDGFGESLALNSLDGTNGFNLNGIPGDGYLGHSVSNAGDINGDDIDDIVLGAPGTDINGSNSNEGRSYVIFGSRNGFSPNLDLGSLDGSNGFTINGSERNDSLGSSVSGAGDINDDGIGDLILAAPGARTSRGTSGLSYVIFGTTDDFDANLDLTSLENTSGFILNGNSDNDGLDISVSDAGDINKDGIDDLIIGDPNADIDVVNIGSGQSYVVFGLRQISGTSGDDFLVGTTNNDSINALSGNDVLIGKAGDDTLDGGDDDDNLIGEGGQDQLFGRAGKDILLGGNDDDSLDGGEGRDRLNGGDGNDRLSGGGDRDTFAISSDGGTDTIADFGGIDRGTNPSEETINEIDVLQFSGTSLNAKNMLLSQIGDDLIVNFENNDSVQVILEGFELDRLENLPREIGNILFNRQNRIRDDFDIFNSNQNRNKVFKENTVTFLNDLDNNTQGFSSSDDVINSQGGNDTIAGASGNDLLRGGKGNDVIEGGAGNDTLVGGAGKGAAIQDVTMPNIGQNYAGSNASESRVNPPDTNGAVGTNHIVELLNGLYKVYDKDTGEVIRSSSLNQFWRNAGVTSFDDAIDPRVLYDPFSKRWFASSGDREGVASTSILLAVSKSSDPTEGWSGFGIKGISQSFLDPVGDFPIIGFNQDGVYVSAFIFGGIEGEHSASVVAIPKQDLLDETPTIDNLALFDNLPSTIISPIVDLDNNSLPHPLFTETGGFPFRRFDINKISDPSIIDTEAGVIFVEPFGSVSTVGGGKQPGTNKTLDIVDSRFKTSLVLQNGAIWGAQDVNHNGRSAVRWFQINAEDNNLLQEGLIADENLDYYYGSIAVNDFDDIVIGFNGSSKTQFVSSLAVVGDASNGETTFGKPIILEESEVSYEVGAQGLSGDDSLRWGDYSSTVVDPEDPFTFWTFQTLAASDSTWSTQITQLILAEGGGQDLFLIRPNEGTDTITDFGGVGIGSDPDRAILNEIDTIHFIGNGFTARNMLLEELGSTLEITFENIENTKLLLENFNLEALDNLSNGVGNILFNGNTSIQDDFDVINANANPRRIFNRNTVTFLNGSDNRTNGFNNSDDIINGQAGKDKLLGFSGHDLLRGGKDNDFLVGGKGNDELQGQSGRDRLRGEEGNDTLIGGSEVDRFDFDSGRNFRRNDFGIDTIFDFEMGTDKVYLSRRSFLSLKTFSGTLNQNDFQSVRNNLMAASSSAAIVYSRTSGNLYYNPNGTQQGLGNGGVFSNILENPDLTNKDFVVF